MTPCYAARSLKNTHIEHEGGAYADDITSRGSRESAVLHLWRSGCGPFPRAQTRSCAGLAPHSSGRTETCSSGRAPGLRLNTSACTRTVPSDPDKTHI